jgi:GGDEF domain-containing protein
MPRPRPVADVPPAALADGEAPAKSWLLALMAARPLRDAAALPVAELTRDGPPLCAAVLRAVGSDAELPRLEPGGDLAGLAGRAGALAGAGSAASAVAAVAHLRSALWHELTTALAPLDAPTTAALAERLAFVCDVVAVAAVAEHASFHVHDARAAPRPPAAVEDPDWRVAVADHIAADRAFALLAIELDDAPRLLAADPDGAAAVALADAEAALREELRPGDVMQREHDGRMWVVAAGLRASGGRALAERLADAIGATVLHGGSLTASIGLAAFPADGTGVGELEARADERLFAARAAGVSIS